MLLPERDDACYRFILTVSREIITCMLTSIVNDRKQGNYVHACKYQGSTKIYHPVHKLGE